MIKDSTVLFLGAGQIGCASCLEVLKRRPRVLILHTLTEEETNESLDWIRNNSPYTGTELIPSFGDILINFSGGDKNSLLAELKYRFGTLNTDLVKSSRLWKLIEKHRPDLIVDGINTATYVGSGNDPYTTSRELLKILETDALPDGKVLAEIIKSSLLSEAIPALIRFAQVLHLAMVEFQVKRYVKISTSGLGGMGFNIQYTHGDLGEPGCSPKLLGKVTAAGILNQLLWTLSHTPGLDIKVIIPTALVGWKEITTKITTKTGGCKSDIPLIDCEQPLDLTRKDVFSSNRAKNLHQCLEIVAVDSGENGYYAIGDMATITTLGQMGCITKEEVGYAVAESLEGSTRYDVCAALDSACLGPTFYAALERQSLLSRMRDMDKSLNTQSVSLGNLGPTVTKHLWELEILRTLRSTLTNIMNSDTGELTVEAEQLILKKDVNLRRRILSLRMPILLEGNRILLGAAWHVPNEKMPQNVPEKMEEWAQEGWVDLRTNRIDQWKDDIRKIYDFFQSGSHSSEAGSPYNWRSVSLDNEFEVGEVLGLIYSLKGGNRKLF